MSRRRRRRSSNGFRGHDDGSDGVPLCKRRSQEIKHPRMASFGEQFTRKLPRQESLRGGKTLVPVVCDEGNVREDEVEAFGLAVGKGADHEGHPVLEAGRGEGRDAGLGVDGWLDEVVLAAEVGEEEGDAAEGFVVAGVEDALEGKEFVVELVAGVEFQQLVGGDDEGVCWRVLGNNVVCQAAEEPAQSRRRLIPLIKQQRPRRPLSLRRRTPQVRRQGVSPMQLRLGFQLRFGFRRLGDDLIVNNGGLLLCEADGWTRGGRVR